MPFRKDKAFLNNMEIENKGVETTIENAPTQSEASVTHNTEEVDYEAIIAEKDRQLAKVNEEKENYRKGMLKAKGKLPEDGQMDNDSPEELDYIIERKVAEKLLSTREAQIQAERDAAMKAVLKRNKELETALKNRSQVTSITGIGSNQEQPIGKSDDYFSNDQIKALRAKGYDDKKIEQIKINARKASGLLK